MGLLLDRRYIQDRKSSGSQVLEQHTISKAYPTVGYKTNARREKRERTRHRLGTTGVRDVDKLVEQSRMLIVVPVAENDGELLVVGVHLLRRVNDDGRAKTVDVLTLDRVRPTLYHGSDRN